MRIRKRLQSQLPPPDSSFLPSHPPAGASATPEPVAERGARESAEENVAAAEHVLERETGGERARFSHSNRGDLVPPPERECISGDFSDLSSHLPPPESVIHGRDLSPPTLFPDFNEAVKREATEEKPENEDAPPTRLSAEDSSQPKTKRRCNLHSRARNAAKTEEQNQEDQEREEEKREKAKKTPVVKKRRSPAVLMEGSRCSRVNGRGWRCCQQTLVGYSLCEHHLGKGRLRSMNSVKCNDKMKRREDELQASEEELEPEKTMTTKKTKKRKIGTVKARSMSSLLHQSDVSRAALPPSSSAPAGVGFCVQ